MAAIFCSSISLQLLLRASSPKQLTMGVIWVYIIGVTWGCAGVGMEKGAESSQIALPHCGLSPKVRTLPQVQCSCSLHLAEV